MLTLFPDQVDFLDRLRAALRSHRSVLAQAPTGFGKTAIATVMAANASARQKRIVFVCHRDFLIEQTSRTFSNEGIFHSFVAAGRRFNPYASVLIASVGTLRNRLDVVPEPDTVIWDEAHHIAAGSWTAVFARWRNARHVGLTATPQRLDGSGMDAYFDDIVLGPTVAWLIENDRLSDYKAYAPSHPDVTGVATRAGDYVRVEIEELMDRRAIIGDMVRHYRTYADGMRAVYFGVSIIHSMHIAAAFNAAGVPAMHLDASSDTGERIAVARRFAAGDVRVLSNVDLFGEGYDLAAQAGVDVSIECIGLARPTQSLGLHLQQVGRGLRRSAGKQHAVILDHAGNLIRHGLPDDDREWSLAGREKKKKGEASAPVRVCKECFGVFATHKRACPYCGATVAIESREAEHVDAELAEISKEERRKTRKMEEWECRSLADLTALGRTRGYTRPEIWAGTMWGLRNRKGQKRADHQAQTYLRI